MIVAIDAGNSAVKVALVRAGEVEFQERLPTRNEAALRDFPEKLRGVISHAAGSQPNVIVLVSVVPSWTSAVARAARELDLPLVIADHATIPMLVRVTHPDRVGSDRLLDAFAAAQLHGTPVIVVDLGTATTVDAVDASGTFVGGAILPGIELSMKALADGTAQLPHVQVSQLPPAIGRDTEGAISAGVVLGQIGAVRELVGRIASELTAIDQPRATVVITGGTSRASWAGVWLDSQGELPPIADVVDPDLTLRGLALLHEQVVGVGA